MDLGTINNYVQVILWVGAGIAYVRKVLKDRKLEMPFSDLHNRLIGYALVIGLVISSASLYYTHKPRIQTVYVPTPVLKPRIIIGWGPLGLNCGFTINAVPLMIFADKDDVAMVCGMSDATRDKLEDDRITISSLFTILPQNIDILSPYSAPMAEALKKFQDDSLKNVPASQKNQTSFVVPIWYEVAVLPKGTNPKDIHKLSDIPRYGGEILSQDTRF
jgi:hypothetical protein